jgi:hypothetical protein
VALRVASVGRHRTGASGASWSAHSRPPPPPSSSHPRCNFEGVSRVSRGGWGWFGAAAVDNSESGSSESVKPALSPRRRTCSHPCPGLSTQPEVQPWRWLSRWRARVRSEPARQERTSVRRVSLVPERRGRSSRRVEMSHPRVGDPVGGQGSGLNLVARSAPACDGSPSYRRRGGDRRGGWRWGEPSRWSREPTPDRSRRLQWRRFRPLRGFRPRPSPEPRRPGEGGVPVCPRAGQETTLQGECQTAPGSNRREDVRLALRLLKPV